MGLHLSRRRELRAELELVLVGAVLVNVRAVVVEPEHGHHAVVLHRVHAHQNAVKVVVQLAATKLKEVAGVEVVLQILVVVVKERGTVLMRCNQDSRPRGRSGGSDCCGSRCSRGSLSEGGSGGWDKKLLAGARRVSLDADAVLVPVARAVDSQETNR
jgi:hypothetical protein